VAVAGSVWPNATLLLQSFSLPVSVAGGLAAMATLMRFLAVTSGLGSMRALQAARETHRPGRLLLYKAGLLALPPCEW